MGCVLGGQPNWLQRSLSFLQRAYLLIAASRNELMMLESTGQHRRKGSRQPYSYKMSSSR
jgi:hypothetical protein